MLRRRKVVQWGLAYAASGWALLQVLGFAADAFHWPDGAKQFAMLILALGLPVAVTLAWFHGDRGEQRVSRTEIAILALILCAGGGCTCGHASIHRRAAFRQHEPGAGPGILL